jgi:hypothetical protein
MLRTGAATNDHIAPQAGIPGERLMWVEYGQFRSKTPELPQEGPKPRMPKQTPAVQEYFEQLMACKCECG